MKQNSKKNYVITSLTLYFTYFIHGIGASILGLYKPSLQKPGVRLSEVMALSM